MSDQRILTPLKVGLLVVVSAYFLFTFHGMFTLSWIGEWDRLGGGFFGQMILIEDITATIGLIFRLIASVSALGAVIYYFVKRAIPTRTAYRIARLVLVCEGIYWLGLSATAAYNVFFFTRTLTTNVTFFSVLNSLGLSVIPTVLESIILPIILFVFAFKLNPDKPLKTQTKWAMITGTLFIVVFWLINSSIWIGVIQERTKGISYLWEILQINGTTSTIIYHPEHLVSFITTVFGLAALALYSAYVTWKTSKTGLSLGSVGVIVLALGSYFLWNYFSWALFAGNTWNDWYAWFLGHNMDLWLLSLPLIGLPLLFGSQSEKVTEHSSQDMN